MNLLVSFLNGWPFCYWKVIEPWSNWHSRGNFHRNISNFLTFIFTFRWILNENVRKRFYQQIVWTPSLIASKQFNFSNFLFSDNLSILQFINYNSKTFWKQSKMHSQFNHFLSLTTFPCWSNLEKENVFPNRKLILWVDQTTKLTKCSSWGVLQNWPQKVRLTWIIKIIKWSWTNFIESIKSFNALS